MQMQSVIKKVLENYDKNERPASKKNDTTFLTLQMSPHFLIDLDEEKSLFHMYTWFQISWNDKRLKWDPYATDGDIQHIKAPDNSIWKPELRIFNGVNSHVDPMRDALVSVSYSGEVTWSPPAEVTAFCDVTRQLKGYPNDIHQCNLTIFSPTYDGLELNIKKPTLKMHRLINTHPVWEILVDRCSTTRSTAKFDCCTEYFYSATVTLVLKRRLPAQLQVVRLPHIVLMALTLSMFWLPSDSGKKIILGTLAIIGDIILSIYVAESTESPRAVFLAVKPFHPLLLAVISAVVLEIFVLNIARICGSIEPPQSFVDLLSGTFGHRLAIWMPRRKSTSVDEIQLEVGDMKVKTKKGWIIIATFLDRVLFGVFVIVFSAIHLS